MQPAMVAKDNTANTGEGSLNTSQKMSRAGRTTWIACAFGSVSSATEWHRPMGKDVPCRLRVREAEVRVPSAESFVCGFVGRMSGISARRRSVPRQSRKGVGSCRAPGTASPRTGRGMGGRARVGASRGLEGQAPSSVARARRTEEGGGRGSKEGR